jgi:hypothetical protein
MSTTNKVVLDNYTFAGVEASQIGAIKSVTNYYGLPIESRGNHSWKETCLL